MKNYQAKSIKSAYIKGDSFLHRQSAGLKVIAVAFIGICLYILPFSAFALSLFSFLLMGLIYACHLPVQLIYIYLRPFLFFLIFATCVALFYQPPAEALTYSYRILLMIIYSALFVLTTPVSGMMALFERIFGLCQYIGINPQYPAMTLTLTLRAIPLMSAAIETIAEAREARGLKARRYLIFLPAFMAVLKTAPMMSQALEARGWPLWQNPSLQDISLQKKDKRR